jgi:hypothetical protein
MEPEVRRFVAMVLSQHDHLRHLMDRVMDSDGTDLALAYSAFRRHLAAHEAAERLAMHPRFLVWDREAAAVLDRLEEERQIAAHLDALACPRDLQRPEAGLDGTFATLVERVEQHLQGEERDELPAYLHRLSDDDAEELMMVLALVEEVAVDHGALPDNASFATLLERADAELEDLLAGPDGR